MLLSVEIVFGEQKLREFALHEANPVCTVYELFKSIVTGQNSSAETFVLPPELRHLPVVAAVGNSMEVSAFQNLPLHSLIGDVSEFGKYFRFSVKAISQSPQPSTVDIFDCIINDCHNMKDVRRAAERSPAFREAIQHVLNDAGRREKRHEREHPSVRLLSSACSTPRLQYEVVEPTMPTPIPMQQEEPKTPPTAPQSTADIDIDRERDREREMPVVTAGNGSEDGVQSSNGAINLITMNHYIEAYNNANSPPNMPKIAVHGMPFNPSAQTCKTVQRVVKCVECGKPRCLYAQKKVTDEQKVQLEEALDGLQYTCGSSLHDFADVDDDNHIFSRVYVRKNLMCEDPVEVPYYVSGLFPEVCLHCVATEDLVHDEGETELHPVCRKCYTDPNKKKVPVMRWKRRRSGHEEPYFSMMMPGINPSLALGFRPPPEFLTEFKQIPIAISQMH
ncbi:uncharacterized protein LOC117119467 [Anneissia japonica]|uniref:uncharacterized protein LOC117119467 n=1 Tax=Anneissia japonica TaxID=1529436 RepID=UPI001425BB5C|nr:uncharacterized protein LOC117119467 [Anneissia japonica]